MDITADSEKTFTEVEDFFYPLETIEAPESDVDKYKDIRKNEYEKSYDYIDLERWELEISEIVDKMSYRILVEDIGQKSIFPIMNYLSKVDINDDKRMSAFIYCMSFRMGKSFYIDMKNKFNKQITEKLFGKEEDKITLDDEIKCSNYSIISRVKKDSLLTVSQYKKFGWRSVLYSLNYEDELYNNEEFVKDLINFDIVGNIPYNNSSIHLVFDRLKYISENMKASFRFAFLVYSRYTNNILKNESFLNIDKRLIQIINNIHSDYGLKTSNVLKTSSFLPVYNIHEISYLLGLEEFDREVFNSYESYIFNCENIVRNHIEQASKDLDSYYNKIRDKLPENCKNDLPLDLIIYKRPANFRIVKRKNFKSEINSVPEDLKIKILERERYINSNRINNHVTIDEAYKIISEYVRSTDEKLKPLISLNKPILTQISLPTVNEELRLYSRNFLKKRCNKCSTVEEFFHMSENIIDIMNKIYHIDPCIRVYFSSMYERNISIGSNNFNHDGIEMYERYKKKMKNTITYNGEINNLCSLSIISELIITLKEKNKNI